MAEYLSNPSESAYFVFTESEVDKRSKLYKAVQAEGILKLVPVLPAQIPLLSVQEIDLPEILLSDVFPL